mgnify:CR=1 FL=1
MNSLNRKDLLDIESLSKEEILLICDTAKYFKDVFTTLGTGKLDLPGVLAEADAQGIGWAVVEQDVQRHLTPMESLTAAYYNMKETGFIE